MKIRIYLLSVLSLAMASFLLVHFGMIWAYGRFYIYESNPVILVLETLAMVAVLGFSFYCMMEQLQRARSNARKAYSGREVYLPIRRIQ